MTRRQSGARKVRDLRQLVLELRVPISEDGEVARRSYGSGSLFVRRDAQGQEAWYGKWYRGNRRVKRKLGPKRQRASSEGLTRAQAERELQRRVEMERPVLRSRVSVQEAGRRYVEHLEHVLERKPSTIADYRSMMRRHVGPFFEKRPIERIGPDEIANYLVAKKREGLATKTITNQLVFLHGLFAFAGKRGWVPFNPVALVDRPRASAGDPDIRYLDLSELEALLRAVPDDQLGPTEHALYLTAAMTGLRQGSWLRCGGSTSTGRPGGSGCAATTRGSSTERRSQSGRRARYRSPIGLPGSSNDISSAPRSRRTTTWCSPIRKRDIRLTRPSSVSASLRRSTAAVFARFGSTTCVIRSAPTAPHPECRSERSRSGWGTRTRRRRRSTRTTRRAHTRAHWSSGHSDSQRLST